MGDAASYCTYKPVIKYWYNLKYLYVNKLHSFPLPSYKVSKISFVLIHTLLRFNQRTGYWKLVEVFIFFQNISVLDPANTLRV